MVEEGTSLTFCSVCLDFLFPSYHQVKVLGRLEFSHLGSQFKSCGGVRDFGVDECPPPQI